MGAVLTTGLVLMVMEMALEVYLVRTLRPEKFDPKTVAWILRGPLKLVYRIGPFIEHSPITGIIWSFGLSAFIGMVFPAAGVMVFIAGVGSTICVQPYYMARRWWARFRSGTEPSFSRGTWMWFKNRKVWQHMSHAKVKFHYTSEGESFS